MEVIGILSLIPNVFSPYDLFESEHSSKKLYFFKGMICFWGSHYFAYFRDFEDTSNSNWKRYDDSNVRTIGDWDDVLQLCVEGREKPILLLFEELKTPDAQYIAQNKHYLNNMIGAAQWREMFDKAQEKDA